MNKSIVVRRIIRIVANTIYIIGVIIVVCLLLTCFFGSNEIATPENAMLPLTQKEMSFGQLALGSAPMILACLAVYHCNEIKGSTHSIRNAILIFLPGLICLIPMLFYIVIWGFGMINSAIIVR